MQQLTGFPSIDMPWLKYYSNESQNASLPERTMYEYLWENNRNHLNETAIVYGKNKITYRELFHQIDYVASSFLNIGVKESDVVTMMVLSQPETVYCIYALNKIGAIPCMINVLSNPKEIVDYMKECDSKYLVVLDALFEKAQAALNLYPMNKIIYLPMSQSLNIIGKTVYRLKVKKPVFSSPHIISWKQFIVKIELQKNYEKNIYSCAIIGHTGGTTGTPKGVMLSDYAVNALVIQYYYKLDFQRKDTFLSMIVPFAVFGLIINIHIPLVLGISTILVPRVDPQKTDELIEQYHPNHILSIPSYWKAVVDSKKIKKLDYLKTAGAGGSGMTVEFEKQLNELFIKKGANIRFLNGYGMSEVGSTACTQLYEFGEIGSVGIPIPKNVISIFDTETIIEKKYNELGEICIQSPSMMLGYVNNEEETKEIIRTHSNGSVWVHTGDVGYMNENGSLFIKGRMKRIYLTQQQGALAKVFPDRIERVLLKHPSISDCCVVCVSHGDNNYVPIAYYELKEEIKQKVYLEDELILLCKKELPEYAIPVKFVFLSVFPRNAMGKIDYCALENKENYNDNL